MHQQINLYLPEFRKEKDILNVRFMAQALVVLVLILGGLTAFDYLRISQLDTALANSQTERQAAIERVNALIVQFGDQSEDPALTARVRNLETELTEKRRLVQFMEGRDFGNTRGFSEHLSDLSRYHLSGLRLTNIALSNGGANISLQGEVLRGELVPMYLQSLSQGETFAGKTFQTVRLDSAGSDSSVQFSVSTGNQ